MKAAAEPPPADAQSLWDRDAAREFQRKVRRLRQAVQDAQTKEADAKSARKSAFVRSERAEDALTLVESEADGGTIPDRWMYRFAAALADAEQAKEAYKFAKDAHYAAIVARLKAQDERRVQERAHFRLYPLFDELARANGDGAASPEPPATPANGDGQDHGDWIPAAGPPLADMRHGRAPSETPSPSPLTGEGAPVPTPETPKPHGPRAALPPTPTLPGRDDWRGVPLRDVAPPKLANPLGKAGVRTLGDAADWLAAHSDFTGVAGLGRSAETALRLMQYEWAHSTVGGQAGWPAPWETPAATGPAALDPAPVADAPRCTVESGGTRCDKLADHAGGHSFRHDAPDAPDAAKPKRGRKKTEATP